MIRRETATKIAFCYSQIEAGEKLLKKCEDHIEKFNSLEWKEGDRCSHLQLGIPLSTSGHSIIQVDDELAMAMIRKHIADKQTEMVALNKVAISEAGEKAQIFAPRVSFEAP